MARLPTRDDLGPAPSGRTGRAVVRYDASAQWAGVASLGADLQRAASDVAATWQNAQAAQADSRMAQWEWDEMRRYDDAVRNVQPDQAQGFAENYTAGYYERAREFKQSLPRFAQGAADNKLFDIEKRIYGDAIDFERGEVKRTSLNALDGTVRNVILPKVQAAAQLPADDPNKQRLLQEAEKEARALLDSNTALTPIEVDKAWNGSTDEKGNWKPGIRENIQSLFLESLSPEEKVYADPEAPAQSVGERIRTVQSGGRAGAKNPNSEGSGPDLFEPGTWRGLVQQFRPDIAKGKSNAEIDALRSDDALSAELRDRYAAENAKILGSRGYGATPGNLYLSHILGPIGAVQMLGAAPETPAADINPKAAAANPKVFYRNGDKSKPLTAGELAAWSEERMRGVARVNWGATLDAVPFDRKLSTAKDGAAALVKQQADQAVQSQAEYDATLNDAKNAVLDGTFGLADWEAASAGWLTDADDRNRVLQMIEERDKETQNYGAAAQRFSNPEYRFNRFDSEDQKSVDLIYDKGPTKGGEGLLEGDGDAVQSLRAIIQRTTILPSGAKDTLRSGLWSGNKEERRAALTVLDGLYRENPDVIAKALDDKDLARLDEYQQMSGLYSPKEIDERFDPTINPQIAARRKELRQEGESLTKDVDVVTILDAFDPGVFTSGPSEPADPSTLAMLKEDYRTVYAETYSIAGNPARAHEEAIRRLRESGKWGVTDVGAGRYLMPYPPEAFYPEVDGSHDWLDDQLQALVEEKAPGAQSWSVVMLPETASVVQFNRANPKEQVPVPYGVGVVDANGIPRVLTVDPQSIEPLVVGFDYGKERDKARGEFEKERASIPAPSPDGEPAPDVAAEPVEIPEGYTMPFKPGSGPTLR